MIHRFAPDPGVTVKRRAGHAPRAGKVLREELVEPSSDLIVRAQVQREQQNRGASGYLRHPRHDVRRLVPQELAERIDERQVVVFYATDDLVECRVSIVRIRAVAAIRKVFVQHRQTARPKASPPRRVLVRDQYANAGVFAGFRRTPGHQSAAVVTAAFDLGLRGP